MAITARITKKGQVTVPLKIREALKSRVIEFVMEDNRIEIRAVTSVAGALKEYADTYVPIEVVREKVWGRRDE